MSNTSMQVFNFQEFPFRAVEIEGATWFVAKDVCIILEIANHKDALKELDDDEKRLYEMLTVGGTQSVNMVNESGLYALIFKSKKPEARNFRKFITSEVLPSIRKYGEYSKHTRMYDILTRLSRNSASVPVNMITALTEAVQKVMLPLIALGAPIKQNAGLDMSIGRYVKQRAKELGLPIYPYGYICNDGVQRPAAAYKDDIASTIYRLIDEWVKTKLVTYLIRTKQEHIIPYVILRYKDVEFIAPMGNRVKQSRIDAWKKQALELDKRKALR